MQWRNGEHLPPCKVRFWAPKLDLIKGSGSWALGSLGPAIRGVNRGNLVAIMVRDVLRHGTTGPGPRASATIGALTHSNPDLIKTNSTGQMLFSFVFSERLGASDDM
ncbi:hypothetical protein TNCV_3896761 [Trichonephila clavipes]|nr:hypothetical protein TNCV_3896761 [Trichonephila clavipes]